MKNNTTLLGNDFFDQNKWNEEAAYYAVMNSMEADGTGRVLELLSFGPEDTVLDIGCGSGRMSIPMARKVKEVTAIDSSSEMIRICKENAAAAGVTNVNALQLDWEKDEDYRQLPKVDIIIQARWSGGASRLKKYCDLCRKYVVIIEWEKNPPRIARDLLFSGCYSEESMAAHPELYPFDPSAYTDQNETKKVKDERDKALRRELAEAGIQMHKATVQSGWEYTAEDMQGIIRKILQLSRYPELVSAERLEENLKPYIRTAGTGLTFYMPTWEKVEWFFVPEQ